jgi:hypothetical protein
MVSMHLARRQWRLCTCYVGDGRASNCDEDRR